MVMVRRRTRAGTKEVPKTSKSPTRNKQRREHEARMKKFNSPEEKAKREKEFQRALAKGRAESLSESDGHAPRASSTPNKFKIDKRSSSSVALPPRDSKEHETAVKRRKRFDDYWINAKTKKQRSI